MNELRDNIFSRTALAGDQNRHQAGGMQFGLFEDFVHAGGTGDDGAEGLGVGEGRRSGLLADVDQVDEALAKVEKLTGNGHARLDQTVAVPSADAVFSAAVMIDVEASAKGGPWAAAPLS